MNYSLTGCSFRCVCNMFFKKKDKRLITYVSGTVRSQLDYIMVKRKDKKFVKDVKMVPKEKIVRQHQLLLYEIIMELMESGEIAKDFNQM